ncbi:MAG: ABC transporter substrate-binding protein [Alphaproteobacteria bacterium]|nr:ABC transporter substrate-binding protein [Alphaproteobacteria bacterium]MDP6517146.1 ABC transporter substrate-binding protein [Alphaproteobacteria bacterium]
MRYSQRFILLPLLAAAVAAASVAPAAAEAPRGVFVMAKALDDLISLDPAEAFEFSGVEVIANLYERLFDGNPADPAAPAGGVVESWEVGGGGREFTFAIRRGLVFHSGNPVTADDAVFSIRRVIRLNKTPAFILTQFGLDPENLDARVRALDGHRFRLTLDRAYAPALVLNVLSAAVTSVVERAAALAHERDGDLGHRWLRTHDAGSGAFRLVVWNPGEHLILDAVPDHHGGAPAIRRVVIRDIREPATQRVMLMRGDIDLARNLGPDQIVALAGAEGIATFSAPQARLFYLGLNQANPILARPEVRRALRYLIDYRGMARTVLAGRAQVHQAFLPIGFPGALEEVPFALDPARARALLVDAGLGDGFAVTMDTRSDPLALQIAQAIQATMAQAGVRIEILPGDGKQVLTRYRARRHDIFIGQWGPDYLDPHTNAAAFARNPDNGSDSADKTLAWRNGWAIPELTEMADAAVLERDPIRRAARYRVLQRRIQEDSPFVILFQEKALIAARDGVKGFSVGLMSDRTLYRDLSK